MNKIKQIPYGVADFVSVKERNLYYADKTMFLQETASIIIPALYILIYDNLGRNTTYNLSHTIIYECKDAEFFLMTHSIGQENVSICNYFKCLFVYQDSLSPISIMTFHYKSKFP